MKTIYIGILLILVVASCKKSEINYSEMNLSTITFYDNYEKGITVKNITDNWNERLLNNEKINAKIESVEIKYLTDEDSNDKKIALIGHTSKTNTKTAIELTEFNNGLKLKEIVITCSNCKNDELNIKMQGGYMYCKSSDESDDCTKISTMQFK